MKIDFTHNLCPGQRWVEINVPDDINIRQLKEKAGRHTGSDPNFITLGLWQKDGPSVPLSDDNRQLVSYGCPDRGGLVEVVDNDPDSTLKLINRTETSPDESQRFRLTDAQYAARKGNAREFLTKLKEKRPDLFLKRQEPTAPEEMTLEEAKKQFALGSRCEVTKVNLRGVVSWVGSVSDQLRQKFQLSGGPLIGVTLDEPLGNFNGRDGDTVLFECDLERRGLLVGPKQVKLGNFPKKEWYELDEI